MKVAIRQLYRGELRLPRQEVRRQQPFIGELTVQKYFSWHQQEIAPVCASLRPIQVEDLDRARILYFSGRNLVLSGYQRIGGQRFDQIWWCRLLEETPTTLAKQRHGPASPQVSRLNAAVPRHEQDQAAVLLPEQVR